MSSNSSKSTAEMPQSSGKKRAVAIRVIGLMSWVLVSFIAAQLIVILGWGVIGSIAPGFADASSAVAQFILSALIYLLTLLIVIGGSVLIKQRVNKVELGVDKPVTWLDLGLAPAAFAGYLVVSSVTILVVSQLLPGFDLQQSQQVGFDNITGQIDLIMAFLALVVLAPIAEEVLFRGYLYGKLRGLVGALVASLLASVLFGAVHMQWNVAIDTFILSMAMCGLRELTGTIWAGTILHMIKNGLAFFLLFIYPSIGF